MDLFDYKPGLKKRFGEEVPTSVYPAERKTTMTSGQKSFPVAPSKFKFEQQGEGGIWMSETMPHLAKVADDICVINSMYTEAINHGPAVTFFQTGAQFPGRPSFGAWLHYGLGRALRVWKNQFSHDCEPVNRPDTRLSGLGAASS